MLLLIVIRILVLNHLQIFYQNKYILKKNGRLLFCYPSLYQNVTEGKFTFIDGRESPEEKRKIQPMHIEPGMQQKFSTKFFDKMQTCRKNLNIFCIFSKELKQFSHLEEKSETFFAKSQKN